MNVEIAQLDTAAIRADGDYDDVSREIVIDPSADGIGTIARQEKTITLPCQLEERDFFERLNEFFAGNTPETILRLTLHLSDLERLKALDDESTRGVRADVKVGDRIVKFTDRWKQPLFTIPNPPGLYVREVTPTGFLETQNLVVVTVGERRKAAV